ncbi:hypothetical protein FOCC_FOCC012679 [Frankliniella occidentalis]|nr:hypothetical protein FOCC_FOCC012679 [Frankliniella occidentalis]
MSRESAALALERLKGRHTHERLALAIFKVHNHFAITDKVTKTTTDSASNFKKAFKLFGAKTDDADSFLEEAAPADHNGNDQAGEEDN